jgi:nucleoside-diphosphate-sugar epimerase
VQKLFNIPALTKLNQSRILITGASSLIGKTILKTLNSIALSENLEIEVWCGTRMSSADQFKCFSALNIYHFRYIAEEEVEIKMPLTHVIHLANLYSDVRNKSEIELEMNTQIAMHNLLKVIKNQANLVRFVFSSSGAVYGTRPLGIEPIVEKVDHHNLKLTSYGRSKLHAEMLLKEATESYQVLGVSARLFTFYGNGIPLDSNFAIGNFMQSALNKTPIVVRTTGNSVRSYMNLNDLGVRLVQLLLNDSTATINIGSANPVSIRELAFKFSQKFDLPIKFLNEFEIPNYYVPNLRLVDSIYGKIDEIELNAGIENWYKELNISFQK